VTLFNELFSDAFYLNAQVKQRLNSKEFEMSAFKVFLVVVSTAFLIVSCGSSTSTSAAASAALPSRIAVL
jgi:hypothetical protein